MRRGRSRSSVSCQWAGLLSSLPSCPPFLKRPLPPWGSPLALAARQPFSAPQYLSRPLCESGSLEQAPAFVPTPWDPRVLTCGPTTLVICSFFSLGLQDSPMSHNLPVLGFYTAYGMEGRPSAVPLSSLKQDCAPRRPSLYCLNLYRRQ